MGTMETTASARASNVIPFGFWYGLLVRTLTRTGNEVLHWTLNPNPTFFPRCYKDLQ